MISEIGEKHAHQCAHCPKSFKKPSDLVRHVRIHTGEKPFACPVCQRTFTVKSTLDSHMKTHGVRKYFLLDNLNTEKLNYSVFLPKKNKLFIMLRLSGLLLPLTSQLTYHAVL